MSVYEPWDARIERVENGYIVYLSGETTDYGSVVICEDVDVEFGDLDALADAMREIQDHFGKSGSKHDARRLWVRVEPETK